MEVCKSLKIDASASFFVPVPSTENQQQPRNLSTFSSKWIRGEKHCGLLVEPNGLESVPISSILRDGRCTYGFDRYRRSPGKTFREELHTQRCRWTCAVCRPQGCQALAFPVLLGVGRRGFPSAVTPQSVSKMRVRRVTRLVQCLFHCRVAVAKPVLYPMNSQHRQQRVRRTTTFILRIMRFDQGNQPLPGTT